VIDGDGLIGSWDLAVDGRDGSGHGRDAVPRGDPEFRLSRTPGGPRSVARFGGGASRLEVPDPGIAEADFSLTAWVNAGGATTTIGDIAAMFDPTERRGFSLGLNHSSSCGNHGNDRNLFFGLDAGSVPAWTNRGRPSASTIMVCALAVHEGDLYAATWEAGTSNAGHVYRLSGDAWVDCGRPWNANAVTRLAVHDGGLYAGVSRLRGGGSGMPDSVNQGAGGRVLRYEGGTDWSDRGQLHGADSVAGLVPFDGDLYAIPMYSEGLFRLAGSEGWISCGTPDRRLLALGVHAGALYGAGNDHADVVSAIAQTAAGIVVPARSPEGGGGVFRFDGGQSWTSLGLQPDTTQVYSIETYDGGMFIGTWPHGIVYRHAGGASWESSGQLGAETEVMNLLAYNGKLYAGTLPGAQVQRFDGDGRWAVVGMLDRTPDVLYRRAASMVVYRGELFCGTLPSGTVHSMRAGLVVSDDRSLRAGWSHVAAVRTGAAVELYVDGSLVGQEVGDAAPARRGNGTGTLVLGSGPRGGFDGELAAVRLFGRALTAAEVGSVATLPPS
jgi:Concanavalin A-like lectin/glucanases superfamily